MAKRTSDTNQDSWKNISEGDHEEDERVFALFLRSANRQKKFRKSRTTISPKNKNEKE